MTIPQLPNLPIEMMMWGGSGWVYGKFIHRPVKLCVLVCAISVIADHALIMIASRFTRNDLEKKATYILTNLVVNTTFIFLIRDLNMIGRQGTLISTAFTIFNFLSKVIELSTSLGEDSF